MFSTIQMTEDHQPLGYPSVRDTAPRPYTLHGTSSAFSSAAAANEDWTQISDLAERRRIQNRIAQRNYRRKLKRRLADLEMRASTSDGVAASSISAISTTPVRSYRVTKKQRQTTQPKGPRDPHLPSLPNLPTVSTLPDLPALPNQLPRQLSSSHRPILLPDPLSEHHQGQQPPSLMGSNRDDELIFSSGHSYDSRLDRAESPSLYPYNTYPAPDNVLLAPFQATQASQYSHHQSHHDNHQYSSYIPPSVSLHPHPPAPASLHPPAPSGSAPSSSSASTSGPSLKRDPYGNDDCFNPYVGYGYVDMNNNSAYSTNPSTSSTAIGSSERSPASHSSSREPPSY